MMADRRLSELANIISHNTQIVEKHMADNNLSPPSFDAHGPSEIILADGKAAEARCTAVGAMNELRCLMLGPTTSLMSVEV